MRPIKLTMVAFGPYKEVEVVDFRELDNRNLFLITGPTGSGKTTLFDGISFAIYGEPSGELRSAENLRSQFSSDDLLTQVELEFEVKGIFYHIHRIPKQIKPKLRGEGYTEQKPEATLTIEDGEPRTIITGVVGVNEKIESIIGINAEQFKQIMMIPQGEFQKLLTSNSEERQRVLQQLFDTSLYNSILQRLDNQARNLYNDIKRDKEIRDHVIEAIACSDNFELQGLISSEDKHVEEIIYVTKEQIKKDKRMDEDLDKGIKALQEKIEKGIEDREKAKANNEKIQRLQSTKQKLKDLEMESANIEVLKEKVKKAEGAFHIIAYEEAYEQKKKEWEGKSYSFNEMDIKSKRALKAFEDAGKSYHSETSLEKSKERDGFIQELTRLHSFQEKVTNIEGITLSVSVKENIELSLEKDKQKTTEDLEHLNQKVETLSKKSELAKDAEIKGVYQRSELNKVEALDKKLQKSMELQKKLNNEETLFMKKEADVKVHLENVNKSNIELKKKRFISLTNQAALLAKELKEGDACPVCGATKHVKLAEFSGKEVTQDELDVLEKRVKDNEQVYNLENKQLAILEERILKMRSQKEELIEELELELNLEFVASGNHGIDFYEKKIKVNQGLMKEIKEDLVQLDQLVSMSQEIKESIKTCINAIKEKEEQLKNILKKQSEIHRILSEEKGSLKTIFHEVPEEIRSLEKLQNQIRQQEEGQKEAQSALIIAQKHYEEAKESLLTINAIREQLKNDIDSLNKTILEARQELEDKIIKGQFIDVDDYSKSKLSADQLKDFRKTISNHEKMMYTLGQDVLLLILQTKDIELAKEEEFEIMLDELRLRGEEEASKKSKVLQRIDTNQGIVEEVWTIQSQMGGKEALYKVVGNLANVTKGNNTSRVTLERYVLAAFLEDIIVAANIRLKPMTDGRYQLGRTQVLERSNSKGGLELEVYDAYTGKSRHVKTLSGGEGFKASLAMALGLSDVVQSYAGGVQLDTMFIDEGFGTLDQESLDAAITCLIDLQKTGRLIGIISHVQELKERIDTKLEVQATPLGSKTRFLLG